jgi:hypothetical protein
MRIFIRNEYSQNGPVGNESVADSFNFDDNAVIYGDGSVREVKNLRWLQNHWKDVLFFVVAAESDERYSDGYLVVRLDFHDSTFIGGWASFGHALYWLDRPVFKALPIAIVIGSSVLNMRIGSDEYEKFVEKHYG